MSPLTPRRYTKDEEQEYSARDFAVVEDEHSWEQRNDSVRELHEHESAFTPFGSYVTERSANETVIVM